MRLVHYGGRTSLIAEQELGSARDRDRKIIDAIIGDHDLVEITVSEHSDRVWLEISAPANLSEVLELPLGHGSQCIGGSCD